MQNQPEEIALLPTNSGKQRENEIFLRSQNTSKDYKSDKQRQHLLKR
jgi:hypothetical protein